MDAGQPMMGQTMGQPMGGGCASCGQGGVMPMGGTYDPNSQWTTSPMMPMMNAPGEPAQVPGVNANSTQSVPGPPATPINPQK
jgi:hypothetical protein